MAFQTSRNPLGLKALETRDQYFQTEDFVSISLSGSGLKTLFTVASGAIWTLTGLVLVANSATGIQFLSAGTGITGNMTFNAGDKIVVGFNGTVVMASDVPGEACILSLDGASTVTGWAKRLMQSNRELSE